MHRTHHEEKVLMESKSSNLVLAKCNSCGKLFMPPAYMCSGCGGKELDDVAATGEGNILSYTTIRVPPLGFVDQAPYEIGVIALPEKVNLTARIIAHAGREIRIGDGASFVEKDTTGAYWFKLSN